MNSRYAKAVLFFIALIILFPSLLSAKAEKPIETFRLVIEIDTPASFLYPYLINEDKILKWRKDKGVEVTFPNGLEPRVGKQIRVDMVNVPTQPWILLEIVKLDENREVLTQFIDGVLEGEFAYILEPLEDGRCRLVHEMRIQAVGALVKLVWKIHGERVHHKKMWNFMQNMKQVVEEEWIEAKVKSNGSDEGNGK